MFILSDFAEKEVRVKQYIRNGRIVRSYNVSRDTEEKDKSVRQTKESNFVQNLVIGASVVGGLGIIGAGLLGGLSSIKSKVLNTARQNITENYKTNIKKSLAKTYSPIVKDLQYKDSDIVFAVNGFNKMPEEIDQYNDVANFIDKLNLGKNKINVIPFTVKFDAGKSNNPIDIMDNLYAGTKTTDKIVELKKTIEAYQEKYPNKKITILGFSMGGSVVTNTADLLKDPKVQTIAIAAPNIRGVQPLNYTAMRIRKDGILPDEVFTNKEIMIDDVEGHNNIFKSRKAFDIMYNKLFNKDF